MDNKDQDLPLYQTQIQTYVGFTSFMTAVVVFFTGLLLTKFESFNISIKIPIAFLIISIFGFLYSTLIYANAAEEVSQKRVAKFKRHLLLGDCLSEYLGIYFLIFSIPLVINVVTTDQFLRIIAFASSMIGLAIYQFSHFSVMERHFKKRNTSIGITILIFGLVLFLTHIYNFYFVFVSTIFIIFLISVAYLSTRQKY